MSKALINGIEQPLVGSTFPNNGNSLEDMVLLPSMPMSPKIGVEGGGDDELTNLTWLQDTNLLKKLNAGVGGENEQSKENSSTDNCPAAKSTSTDSSKYLNRNTPSYVTYNPNIHVNSKPPYSFSCLIFMAIEHSKNKALPVKDIYSWMLANFPYFQRAPIGWKNSVRHNLSLNRCFMKVDINMKPTTMVKGSYWSVDKQFRPNLVQALRKSSYQPYNHVFMISENIQSSSNEQSEETSSLPSSKNDINTPSPDLFPFLSKRLKETKAKKPEVDAATAMLAMKNGSHALDLSGCKPSINSSCMSEVKRINIKWKETNRKRKVDPVITISPSDDHTYCVCSPKRESSPVNDIENNNLLKDINHTELCSYNDDFSSSDADDFVVMDDQKMELDEEQKKIAEGADALLNLAGITTRKRRRLASRHYTRRSRISS